MFFKALRKYPYHFYIVPETRCIEARVSAPGSVVCSKTEKLNSTSRVVIITNGHASNIDPGTAVEVKIFIDGKQADSNGNIEYDPTNMNPINGMGYSLLLQTHPMMATASVILPQGDRKIEVRVSNPTNNNGRVNYCNPSCLVQVYPQ